MDSSRQLFEYNVNSTDISFSSYATIPSIPNRLFGSLKDGSTNSPDSPFLTHFGSDILSTFNDGQENHSSQENHYEASPSYTSSLDGSSQQQELSLSPDSSQERRTVSSGDGNCGCQMKHALQQLESALMGPDEFMTSHPSVGETKLPQTSDPRSMAWSQEMQDPPSLTSQSSYVSQLVKSEDVFRLVNQVESFEDLTPKAVPAANLKQLLMECARALHENQLDRFDKLITIARASVSISGEPIQRLGAYMIEGLVARTEASGSNIYKYLRCKEPEGKELLSYMHILYKICPYLKFGYMAANGAIAEACRNEDRIHIIDFQIGQGTQWMTLLQALASRPSGAPYVRITGIDDPVSKYAREEGLAAVGRRLAAISEKFNILVEFHPVPVFAPDLKKEMLDVRHGEALVVNFPLQLHHTPDESIDVTNPRDGLLRMVKSLNPKVVTLIEQESNANTAPFLSRFWEALEYYSAMFESIDVTMPRDKKERINVEQQCLAREIVNIIACEGKERMERHELLGKWKSRFTMAGFQQYPLSSYVNSVIRSLLKCYSEDYTLIEIDGAMLLGWKDRSLVSASAWY